MKNWLWTTIIVHIIDSIFYTLAGYYCIQKLGYFGDSEF